VARLALEQGALPQLVRRGQDEVERGLENIRYFMFVRLKREIRREDAQHMK